MHCFPGGAIQQGETEPQALQRELVEELALAVDPLRRLWRSVAPWNVELAWWQVRLDDPGAMRPNPAEVEAAVWLSVPEMLELPSLLESNRQFLAAWGKGEFVLEGLSPRNR